LTAGWRHHAAEDVAKYPGVEEDLQQQQQLQQTRQRGPVSLQHAQDSAVL
jgi:hypothetical protein